MLHKSYFLPNSILAKKILPNILISTGFQYGHLMHQLGHPTCAWTLKRICLLPDLCHDIKKSQGMKATGHPKVILSAQWAFMIFWYSSYKVYHSILLRMKIDHPQRYWKFLLQIYLIFKNPPTNPCGSVIIADSLPSWECVQPADRTTSCGGRTVEFILVPLQCWNLLTSPEFL